MLTGLYYANSLRYGRYWPGARKLLRKGPRHQLYIDFEPDTQASRRIPRGAKAYIALNLNFLDTASKEAIWRSTGYERRPRWDWQDAWNTMPSLVPSSPARENYIGSAVERWPVTGTSPEEHVRRVLAILRPRWKAVNALELADEPMWNPRETGALARMVKEEVQRARLAPKPVGAVYTRKQILTSKVWDVPDTDYLGLEYYLDPVEGESVTQARRRMYRTGDSLNDRVDNSGKLIFVVGQAYDRNAWWEDEETLVGIQAPVFDMARGLHDDGRLLGLGLFSWARPGGARDHKPVAQEIARLVKEMC